MNTAAAAPRDNASRPSAPVPAKASSTAASAKGTPLPANFPCDRILNSASRARSLVGLTVSPGGARRRRPRCLPATIRMAERLRQHFLWHLVDHAPRQIAELERPVGKADQPRHLQPQMFEHAAHLSVLPFTQGHRDPRVAALPPFEARAD